MRNIILCIFTIVLIISCNDEVNNTENFQEKKYDSKVINDSVMNLMNSFLRTDDSIALEKAINLNLESMKLDSSNNNIAYCKNIRCNLLYISGQYRAAFELKKSLVTNEFDIKIMNGLNAEIEGKQDSSVIYYTEALKYSDLALNKTPGDYNSLVNKVISLIYLRNIDLAKEILDQEVLKHPERTDYKSLKENLDRMNSDVLEFIRNLKS